MAEHTLDQTVTLADADPAVLHQPRRMVTTVEQPQHGHKLLGYLVEFEDVDTLMHGCEQVRDAGYTIWDAHTPFPVHGLNEAMGLRPSFLQWLVLGAALTGLATAVALQFGMNYFDYPINLSGKPLNSLPANIPIIFECTVLFSTITCFFGMLGLNNLPRFHHPVFHSARFARFSDDRFFISVEARDPKFDAVQTRELLTGIGGLYLEPLEDTEEDA
jgi:hypothetical protein